MENDITEEDVLTDDELVATTWSPDDEDMEFDESNGEWDSRD